MHDWNKYMRAIKRLFKRQFFDILNNSIYLNCIDYIYFYIRKAVIIIVINIVYFAFKQFAVKNKNVNEIIKMLLATIKISHSTIDGKYTEITA